MRETIIVASAKVAKGAGLSDAAFAICLPLLVIITFVSIAAHSEAEKEYERKKAAGEPVPIRAGLSWVSLVNVLPKNRKRPYFIFIGACVFIVFITVLIDKIAR